MKDPRKQRYVYGMMAGFGAISLSILFFFLLFRLQGVGKVITELSGILAPFIYGGIMAYLLRPLCNALEAFFQLRFPKKLKRFANATAVMSSLIIGILVIYALLTMVLPQLYNSLMTLWEVIPGKIDQLIRWANKTFAEDERIIDLLNQLNENYYNDFAKFFQNMTQNLKDLGTQVTNIVTGVGTGVVRVATFLYNILIGLIVAIYVLHGRKRFGRQATLIVRSLFPERWANLVLEEAAFVDRMFGGFIDGKIIDSAIIGVLCYVGCAVLRIPNAMLVSVLVGVTNIIPFFGPVIGAVPATLLILIESPVKALTFVIFVLVLQQLDGNVIGPKILGNRTGLSGFWVMFCIILFGGMWGIVGMVIAVPLFAVIYDTIRRLVIRGLKKNGHVELWEEYRSAYPEPEDPKKK